LITTHIVLTQAGVNILVAFLNTCGEKDKHKEENNKKTCQVAILKGSYANKNKVICKAC
jgi:hypothetical protein